MSSAVDRRRDDGALDLRLADSTFKLNINLIGAEAFGVELPPSLIQRKPYRAVFHGAACAAGDEIAVIAARLCNGAPRKGVAADPVRKAGRRELPYRRDWLTCRDVVTGLRHGPPVYPVFAATKSGAERRASSGCAQFVATVSQGIFGSRSEPAETLNSGLQHRDTEKVAWVS